MLSDHSLQQCIQYCSLSWVNTFDLKQVNMDLPISHLRDHSQDCLIEIEEPEVHIQRSQNQAIVPLMKHASSTEELFVMNKLRDVNGQEELKSFSETFQKSSRKDFALGLIIKNKQPSKIPSVIEETDETGYHQRILIPSLFQNPALMSNDSFISKIADLESLLEKKNNSENTQDSMKNQQAKKNKKNIQINWPKTLSPLFTSEDLSLNFQYQKNITGSQKSSSTHKSSGNAVSIQKA